MTPERFEHYSDETLKHYGRMAIMMGNFEFVIKLLLCAMIQSGCSFIKKNALKSNLYVPDFVRNQASNPPDLALLDRFNTSKQLRFIRKYAGTGLFGPKEQYESWCERSHRVLKRRNKLIHGTLFVKTDGSIYSFSRFKGVNEDRDKGIDANLIQSIEELCQEINGLLIEWMSFFSSREDSSRKHLERQEPDAIHGE